MRTRRILSVLLLPAALAATAALSAATPVEEPLTIGLLETAGPWAEAVAAGARQAVAEVNVTGGVAGRPLRLAELQPARPWRDFGSLAARLVSAEEPLALIGPSDGAAAHLSAQIATRFRVPLITLSPESSLTRAYDPWIFRGVPDDEERARRLLESVLDELRGRRAVAVVPAGRSGRGRRAALQRARSEVGAELVAVTHPGRPLRQRADVLLLWLDPEAAQEFLDQLDDTQIPAAILYLRHLDLELGRALGYDLVRLVAEAAASAGARPQEIRQYLAQGRTFTGRSGTFHFDRQGNRRGELTMSRPRSDDTQDPSLKAHTLRRRKR